MCSCGPTTGEFFCLDTLNSGFDPGVSLNPNVFLGIPLLVGLIPGLSLNPVPGGCFRLLHATASHVWSVVWFTDSETKYICLCPVGS